MAERSPSDDPENMKNSEKGFLDYDVTGICFVESTPGDNRDLSLQEESTKINLDLCDDGAAQEPQVKGSASASSSAINEADKETDASSSSRNRETGEIRRVGKEKDRNDGDTPEESDNESDLKKRYPEIERYYDRFLGLSDHREEAENREKQIDEETMNPQQQLRGPNHGSTSSTSDRTNISQTIGMQSQLYPSAASWRLQNTYQQHPMANQMPRPNQLYIPPMSQDQMMYPYQHPVANQIYPYQHPVANQMYPYHHPVPNQMYPYHHPVPNQMYPYHHPVANQMYPYQHPEAYPYQHPEAYPYQHLVPNQHDFYQHDQVASQQNVYHYPMVDPRMPQYRNVARGQPRSFGRGQNYYNPRQARPHLNQQMMQRVPQTQQPRQSQGFNARPTSEQGQDQ